MRGPIAFLAAVLVAMPAAADFLRWSAETDNDPFTGGQRVTVSYMSSLRSGVFIICDTAEEGLIVRAVPGFTYTPMMEAVTPTLEFAFDGKRVLGQEGRTGAVGDSLATAETQLSVENSWLFAEAFAGAKRQIAIKDGISDRPHLLKASGSTKAGAALVRCMQMQKSDSQ